ncbi:MAG: WD40 repeat domain-containing serine/threonine protein kinase [Gemmataceae bacterium]
MGSGQWPHPDVERLTAFALGRLELAEIDAIESHVASCGSCCRTIEQVQDDTFVSQVREGHRAGTAAGPSVTEPPAMLGAGDTVDYPAELANHPRYRVVRLLGSGGMGTVYQALHLRMDREVALKVINPELVASLPAVERFQREVRAAARLHHPNIVTAHDADKAGGLHFLVMEYVQGTDLHQEVQRRGPLPVAEACGYARQAALGLQHALESGMVHRDIKPHNLMLTPAGQVKILDFGLAALAGESVAADPESSGASGLTRSGTLMGTPDYMAPEQARNAHEADIRADIYSLGCTLYCLLTGHPPFPKGTAIDKVIAHSERRPRAVSDLRKGVPPALGKVLDRMMAKDPARRYQTPAEVATALAPFADRLNRPRRRRVGVLLAGVAAAALAGVIFVATDGGQLRIDSKVDDVKVVVTSGGRELEVIDLKSGSTVKRLRSGEYALTVRGDRDDVKLSKGGFTMTRGGEVVVEAALVDAPAVVEPVLLARWAEGKGDIDDCEVTSDGQFVLVGGGRSGMVRVWDARTRELVFTVKEAASGAGFTPDGRQLVVLNGGEKADFRVYDLKTKSLVRRFGTTGNADDFELSADGTRLLLIKPKDGGEVWDFPAGKKLFDVPCTINDAVKLTPDGRHLLRQAIGRPPLEVYDAGTGKKVDAYRQLRDVPSLGTWWPALSNFSADGHRLLALGADSLSVYDVATGKPIREIPKARRKWGVLLTGDGRRVIAPSVELLDALGVWDVETGRQLATLTIPEEVGDSAYIRVSRDGGTVLAALQSGGIYLFRVPVPRPR